MGASCLNDPKQARLGLSASGMGTVNEARVRGAAEMPLRGWREIAGYFGRDESTVRRWASERQLPVHRAGRESGRGVPIFAFASELEGWLRSDSGRETMDVDRISGEPAAMGARAGESRSSRMSRRRLIAWAGGIAAGAAAGVLGYRWDGRGGFHGELEKGGAISDEARDLYLRGSYLWNRRTPEGIAGAIDALTRALEIEPDYAEARASLAMTYNLARQYSGMSGWEAYPKAEEHARRAVELAPDYAFGQSVLAFVEFHWLWHVQAGLDRFEAARRLDPSDANNLLWYASSLIHVQSYDHALRMLTHAQELDPENATIHNFKALTLHALGRREEGMALLAELIRNDPDHPWHYNSLALCLLAEHDYGGYLENFARVGDMVGVARHRAVADAGLDALKRSGEQAMAAAMAAVDMEFFEQGQALAWDVAIDHAMVGNAGEAMPWLRTSLQRHEERLIGVKYNTAFQPIRDRPGYRRLLRDVGLPV